MNVHEVKNAIALYLRHVANEIQDDTIDAPKLFKAFEYYIHSQSDTFDMSDSSDDVKKYLTMGWWVYQYVINPPTTGD